MPQESEHNMGDFEISSNTFPTPQTNVGRLQIPTTAAELAIVAQQYAEDFLSWIQDAQRAESIITILRGEINALRNNAAVLNSHIADLDNTITAHETEGTTANTVIEELRDKLATAELAATAQPRSSTSVAKSEKLPDPPIFYGDQKEIRGWMADMNMKLLVNADRYPSLQSQLAYIVSRTGGNAKNQLLPHVKIGSIDFATIETCFSLLTLAFDDPDRKATALRKLRTLKQGNKPFNEYLAEFQRYIAEVNYNDESRKNTLMGGISDKLQDLLVTQDEPSTYSEAVTLLQKLDSKRRARNIVYTYTRKQTPRPALLTGEANQYFNTQASPNSYRPIPRPSLPTAPSVPRDPDAMDLSQAQGQRDSRSSSRAPRGPISDAEKQRRLDKNACLYCGEEGHFARGCGKKKRAHLHAYASELNTDAQSQSEEAGNGQPST
jgi:hypothetical protein